MIVPPQMKKRRHSPHLKLLAQAWLARGHISIPAQGVPPKPLAWQPQLAITYGHPCAPAKGTHMDQAPASGRSPSAASGHFPEPG